MAVDLRGMTPLLQVFDKPTSLRFDRDILGFEVVPRPAMATIQAGCCCNTGRTPS